MSKNYQKWLEGVDEVIKKHVFEIARSQGVEIEFQGYYFEDNILRGQISPSAIYTSFQDYDEKVLDTMFIDHARYWFKLTKNKIMALASVHLYESLPKQLLFSIEDTSRIVEINPGQLNNEDFKALKELVIEKFQE